MLVASSCSKSKIFANVCYVSDIKLWLLGLEPEAGKFFFFMLSIALMASCASALAFAISARAPVTTLAIVGTAVSFILQVVRVCVQFT